MRLFAILLSLSALVYASSARTQECDVYSQRLILTPTPLQAANSLRKLDDILGSVPERAQGVFLGDSLLALWPKELLRDQFDGASIWNAAIPGTKIQGLIWILNAFKSNHRAVLLQPKFVVLMIGTNNLGEEATSSCAMALGTEAAAQIVRDIWPLAEIYIGQMPPRGKDFRFAKGQREDANRTVREWARQNDHVKIFQADENQLTCGVLSGGESLPFDACGDPLSRCKNYKSDFVHFQESGYQLLYAAIKAVMSNPSITPQ